MSSKPKISVLTASKNGARFLRETIESILQQSFTDYEHVLADSASTDNTVDILKEHKHIRWISEPDQNAEEGFSKALAMAQGEYIMICCVSDGYIDRDWFRKCADVLDRDPEVSLVYGIPQHKSEDGTLGKIVTSDFMKQSPPQKIDFFPFWLGTFAVCPEITWCVRSQVFKQCLPQHEASGYFLQNNMLYGFNYNFNIHGYLPFFVPSVASFGRYHHDSSSLRLAKENRMAKDQYKSAVIQYGKDVLSGTREHVFRDGQGDIIKKIEPGEFDFYRKKVLDYRLNRRSYLGKRPSNVLSRNIEKLKILAGYHFAR
jgi:glycosyltransferase involved in cell wall biosynthesis